MSDFPGRFTRQLFAALALASSAVHAQGLVLGVTEGLTYRATDSEIAARFDGIADQLSKALKQRVTVQVISVYNQTRDTLKSQKADIFYIHPAHVALEAVKAGTYRSVAWTNGFTEYKVAFLCKEDQPISNWKAITSKKVVTPDPDSITAVMTRAMFSEQGIDPSSMKILSTRYQDAVPFYVENNFANYGATASRAVIKTWRDKGGKVCAESKPVPIKQWLVSSKLDEGQAALVRDTLLGLSQSDAGKKALSASTYSGMLAVKPDVEKSLITWLAIR